MKNPLTPAEIETATFRFVAQHLNHCATAVPRKSEVAPFNLVPKQEKRTNCRNKVRSMKESERVKRKETTKQNAVSISNIKETYIGLSTHTPI